MLSAQLPNQIEAVSKKDRTLSILKEAILTGKFASGAPLAENRVAQQLGVAQSLVREALIELEHQGFVQRVPYKGTYVTKLSRADIQEIFALRCELEALAGKWAAARATKADIVQLRTLISGMRQGARQMNLEQFYANDLAFHRRLWELSGNRYLVETLERIVIPLFAFFLMRTKRVKKSYLESIADHERIVTTLESGDAERLHAVITHTLSSFQSDWFTKLLPHEE